jgi:hypothetical protein
VSLDALAPDQRAVVQLVLQQDRSYEDLAALLGITAQAVRERAHRGLDRLAPTEGVDAPDRAEIADYLLGQQSVSGRETTRALLSRTEPARAWALAVAAELAGVARSALPEVPSGEAARAVSEPEDDLIGPFVPDPGPGPDLEPGPEPITPVIADPLAEDEAAPTRARPRPRRQEKPIADYGFDEPADTGLGRPDDTGVNRTSRLGGALLIAGLGIFVAVLIVWLVTRGDDSGNKDTASKTPSATATSSPTASATPNYQAIGKLDLASATGGDAQGRLIVYAAQTGEVAFNIRATKMPATQEGQAYGVWLTGGDKAHFLGFAPPVGNDGKLAVSGPRQRDATNFATWLGDAKQIVVSTETQEGATAPGPLVLEGDIAKATTPGGAAASPTP